MLIQITALFPLEHMANGQDLNNSQKGQFAFCYLHAFVLVPLIEDSKMKQKIKFKNNLLKFMKISNYKKTLNN